MNKLIQTLRVILDTKINNEILDLLTDESKPGDFDDLFLALREN